MEGLNRKILVSMISSYIGQFAKMVISFGSKIILARMIAPESWGIFAEALLIVTICGAIRDMGIPFHIVREKKSLYGNVLLIEIFMSVLLIILVQIFAPLSSFLNADLPTILRLFSGLIFLEGIAVVPKVFAEKELLIKRIIGFEILDFAFMAVISLLLAYLNYGVWSLVIGQLSGQALYAVLIWNTFKGKIPIRWEMKYTGYLVKKSLFLFFVWAFAVTWTYIDNGIIGAILPEQEVGFYFMAYFIATLVPQRIIASSIYRVLYPAMVQLRGNKEKLIKAYSFSTIVLMCVQVPIAAFLFFNADIVVKLLLSEKWIPIIPLIRILSLSPIMNPIGKLGIEVLKVLHHDRIILLSSALRLFILVVLGILLTKHFGVIGMAWANLLLFGSIPSIWKVISIYQKKIKSFLVNLANIYLISFLTFGVFYFLGRATLFLRISFSIIPFIIVGVLYYKCYGRVFTNFVKSAMDGVTVKTELVRN